VTVHGRRDSCAWPFDAARPQVALFAAPMLNVFAGLGFAVFLLAAIVLRATEGRAQPSGRRRHVTAFVALFLALSFTAGLSQRDLWPFAHWPIVSLVVRPYIVIPKLVGVDAKGVEHDLDFRALQPLGLDELSPWLLYNFTRLPGDGQERAAGFILERAESARRRAASGGRVGDFERYLGPLTAPYFLLHPHRWTSPERTPQRPFVRLRVYHLTWERGTGIVARDLEYETR
jgi:hypothetical protein